MAVVDCPYEECYRQSSKAWYSWTTQYFVAEIPDSCPQSKPLQCPCAGKFWLVSVTTFELEVLTLEKKTCVQLSMAEKQSFHKIVASHRNISASTAWHNILSEHSEVYFLKVMIFYVHMKWYNSVQPDGLALFKMFFFFEGLVEANLEYDLINYWQQEQYIPVRLFTVIVILYCYIF